MKNRLFLFCFILCVAVNAQEQKLTIAVLNLKNAAEVSKGEADIISDRLRIELFKTGNVDVMEREQMQTILAEQGFQQSGVCSDEGCMVEMGQLLGVQRLITGSIGKLGSIYLLNLRAIDVKTGRISKVVSEDIKGGIEGVVKCIPGIAWNLTSEKAKKAPPPEKPDPEPEKKEQPEEKVETKPPPKCAETVFLEKVDFSRILPFTVEKETYKEINEYIRDAIEEAVEEEIDDDLDVEVLTSSQIKQLPPDCKSGLVKMVLESYTTRQSGTQNIGKVKACFYCFDTPHSSRPRFKVTIEESGSRHWGDQQPLINAIEEVADELRDQLEDSDYIDYLDPDKK